MADEPGITDWQKGIVDLSIKQVLHIALPGIIPDEHRLRLNADVDRLEADRGKNLGFARVVAKKA